MGQVHRLCASLEERALHVLRNVARLFPTEYRSSKYGAYEWCYKGSATWEWDTGGYCAQAAAYPVYSYSMGNQASRFHAWDKFACDDAIGHETCSTPNRCDRFSGCGFSERSRTFIPLGTYFCFCTINKTAIISDANSTGGIWAKAEGVHGMNNGLDGGHCSAIFDPDYKYFGIGYWPSMSSATYLYIKNGPPRDYPIYAGSHFDETAKIASEFYHAEGKHVTFAMGWYGDADTVDRSAHRAYLLYRGTMTEMALAFGDSRSGIYEAHFAYPAQCEPYAFVVQSTDGVLYRLPQQESYFFGTSWVELEKGVPFKPGVDYAVCDENHYYRDAREGDAWIDNGGENLTVVEITYVDQAQRQGCPLVESLARCYSEFVETGVISDQFDATCMCRALFRPFRGS